MCSSTASKAGKQYPFVVAALTPVPCAPRYNPVLISRPPRAILRTVMSLWGCSKNPFCRLDQLAGGSPGLPVYMTPNLLDCVYISSSCIQGSVGFTSQFDLFTDKLSHLTGAPVVDGVRYDADIVGWNRSTLACDYED